MTLDNYLLFVLGSIVLIIVPGPDMIYLLSRCIAQGRKAGLVAALGFNVGGYFHLTAAILGLSAILATSPAAFTVVKWLGAAYLVYLGVQALLSTRNSMALSTECSRSQRLRQILWQGFLSDVLNPKVAIFFLAFLPQFIDRNSSHPTLQLILLGVTVNMLALVINVPLVLLSSRVTEALRRRSTLTRQLTQMMGLLFIVIGLRVATT